MDPYNPLSYRPISLISIPCKIYADVLNMRLSTWLEENELLAEEQNGFRKKRSCLDHIYSLISVIKNRKLKRQQTYVCFIDAKKALIVSIGIYHGSNWPNLEFNVLFSRQSNRCMKQHEAL